MSLSVSISKDFCNYLLGLVLLDLSPTCVVSVVMGSPLVGGF